MNFARKSLNSLMLAGLLAGAAGAMAQGTDAAPAALNPASAATAPQKARPHAGEHRMDQRNPARLQERMARHQAELKAKLKITPAQEGAWSAFTAAMQPPANMMGQRPGADQHAELAKLPTPERIDRMRALRTERMNAMNTEMDKRAAAVKTFYAALSPEQQKTFDAEHQKMMMARHGGHGAHGQHGRGTPEGGMMPHGH